MNKRPFFLLFLLSTMGLITFSQVVLDSIPDGRGYTYIASPTGTGPFPAVLYNHGGLGAAVVIIVSIIWAVFTGTIGALLGFFLRRD